MKPWITNGSRSPSLSSSGDWQEDEDSILKKNLTSVEEPVISVVECQKNLGSITLNKSGGGLEDSNSHNSTSGPSNLGGRQYSSFESGDWKDDKKNYNHQHNNHQNYNRNNNQNQNYSSVGYGQYNNNGKRNNNLNYNNHRHQYGGNNNGYGGYNQRRQFNHNFNNYNNFRNYGNK